MSRPTPAAILVALFPAFAAAEGWELRAGLAGATATACTDSGTCFGVECRAADGWRRSWLAVLEPATPDAPADPILGLRLDGTRHALTTLVASPEPGRYTAPLTAADTALLEALMSGQALALDPGRDFAPADLSLAASRWAIGAALALCDTGGPDRFLPEDAAD